VLQDAGSRREHHVGGGSGHDDQIDVLGLQPRSLQSPVAGLKRQIRGFDPVIGKVSRPDAGALHDPVVRGFHAVASQLRHQIGIAQTSRGQKTASAQKAGTDGIHVGVMWSPWPMAVSNGAAWAILA